MGASLCRKLDLPTDSVRCCVYRIEPTQNEALAFKGTKGQVRACDRILAIMPVPPVNTMHEQRTLLWRGFTPVEPLASPNPGETNN